jgi:hypothetical protein
MEDHKKVFFIQILIEVEVVKLHFEVDTKICMVDIINVNLMKVDKKKFRRRGSCGGRGGSY